MSEHQEVPPEAGDDSEDAVVDGKIAVDCPCINCEYNLRGLDAEAQCPECGVAVSQTLRMIESQVLCPSCLAPTHPSQPNCPICGSPLQTSGAVAALAGGKLHIPSSGIESESPRLAPLILLWVVVGPFAILGTVYVWVAIAELLLDVRRRGSLEGIRGVDAANMILYLFVAALFVAGDVVLYIATRSWIRRWQAAPGRIEEDPEDGNPEEPREGETQ